MVLGVGSGKSTSFVDQTLLAAAHRPSQLTPLCHLLPRLPHPFVSRSFAPYSAHDQLDNRRRLRLHCELLPTNHEKNLNTHTHVRTRPHARAVSALNN